MPPSKQLIIAGPTATGKTTLALELAQKFSAEVINADSRQIYQFLDIGTNKEPLAETGNKFTFKQFLIRQFAINNTQVTGWVYDIIRPGEYFSLADYQELALQLQVRIAKGNKLPILVGGTGLYIDSLLKGYELQILEPNMNLRRELESLNVQDLQKRLAKLSPDKFQQLNESDKLNSRRLIRALEILNSELGSSTQSAKLNSLPKIESLFIYPKFDLSQLYEKIERRVEVMFEQGMIQEVESLIKMGYVNSEQMKGMGYKEVSSYLAGEMNLQAAKDKIKQRHRNYAKRQITWFERGNRNYNLNKFDFEQEKTLIFNEVANFIKK